MLECNKLRVDPGNGCPALEYRVEGGSVEYRVVAGGTEELWRPLSSEQLSSHVMEGTVVAHWLRRRIGVYRLMQACNQDTSFDTSFNDLPQRTGLKAA
jgi:hypothetical protein